MNELRREPLLGRWVSVLSSSLKPQDYTPPEKTRHGGPCTLCPGESEDNSREIYRLSDDKGDWSVKVIQRTAGVFTLEGDLGRHGVGMYDKMNSIGTNEIVIESPDHDRPAEDLGPEQMRRVINVFLTRMFELEKDPRLRYIMIHKNYGLPSADTYGHPHSLITAVPVIPKRIKEELDGSKRYYEYKERCIFCDLLREEERLNERIILKTEHFFTFAPFAARFPFEVWIVPIHHRCSFRDISEDEKNDLAYTLTVSLKKLRKVLNNPPYNYIIHTAPSRIPRRNQWHTLGEDFHWHIEVMPRIRRLSGFELGSGMYTLSTSPEDAAKYLKEVSDGD
ncbi:galactose-1-phosphate uridylyltransferase [bacterium BMS3Bbin06]|nr:galactose-1-phosphate uridylyltransferase [bacterium BMS3Bbin06]